MSPVSGTSTTATVRARFMCTATGPGICPVAVARFARAAILACACGEATSLTLMTTEAGSDAPREGLLDTLVGLHDRGVGGQRGEAQELGVQPERGQGQHHQQDRRGRRRN